MIRAAKLDDLAALVAVEAAVGLLAPGDPDGIGRLLIDYCNGDLCKDHCVVTGLADGKPVGVAYYAPERVTDGTWNTYLIAVHPHVQRQGHGTTLMRHIEKTLRAGGGRLLLVETSSLPRFESARAFYRRCGFEHEARVRDFYSAGEDKIIFRKLLAEA